MKIIAIANEIVNDPKSAQEVIVEAKYHRAKAYIASNNSTMALNDLQNLAEDTRTAFGAEAKFLLAQVYYDNGEKDNAEKEIVDFTKKNTPYPYWLARGFILLSDIYIDKQEDFQAKQYLLSLQRNYKVQDDIQEMITKRLNDIAIREKSKVSN